MAYITHGDQSQIRQTAKLRSSPNVPCIQYMVILSNILHYSLDYGLHYHYMYSEIGQTVIFWHLNITATQLLWKLISLHASPWCPLVSSCAASCLNRRFCLCRRLMVLHCIPIFLDPFHTPISNGTTWHIQVFCNTTQQCVWHCQISTQVLF